ncbi:MAG TPA: hypothetical protein VIS09_02015 [Streptomyces sp.]
MTTDASGLDLARLALAQYEASTKNQPQQPRQTARHPLRNVRNGDRREPSDLGNVLTQLAGDLGWQPGVQGGWTRVAFHPMAWVETGGTPGQGGCIECTPSDAPSPSARALGG